MPLLKYHGPCPEHVTASSRCLHCKALATRARRAITGQKTYAKKRETPIYRGLHWPAPVTR